MIIMRIFMAALVLMLVIYYVHVIMHLFGAAVITHRKITFIRCIIPFYYWITDPNILD
nr:MAG TPA: hypothetical protein [Caudoviricetes sp.]